MNSTTIIILASITLLVLIIFLLINKRLSTPTKRDKEKGKDYLEKFRDSLYKSMIDIVVKYDYKKYENIIDLEMDIINTLITYGRTEINNKINESLSNNTLSPLIAKAIDEETIDKFINTIIDKLNIEDSIQQSLSDAFQDSVNENKKLEEEITNQFDSSEFFTDEEVDENTELEVQNIEPTEEELAQLNPPREDGEEPYDPNDESMELISEEENPTDILQEIKDEIIYDSRGRAKSAKTGKFVKKDSIL